MRTPTDRSPSSARCAAAPSSCSRTSTGTHTHSGQLFICGMCGRGFNRSATPRTRQMLHSGQKPQNLPPCRRPQETPQELHRLAAVQLRHLREELHPGQPPEEAQETRPQGAESNPGAPSCPPVGSGCVSLLIDSLARRFLVFTGNWKFNLC